MQYRWFLFVLLVFLHQTHASNDRTCCEHKALSYFCPHCYGCAVRNNPAEELARLLDTKFFGQAHAIDAMLEMFESHMADKRLTSFHIAGDNGVGKSYVARLFAEALYYDTTRGLLILSGTNYQGSDKDTVARHKETLFNIIVAQLEKCPSSLIVIDDVQYLHSSTLLVLQQFMDTPGHVVKRDGTKVQTNKAFIGLISDFGLEGMTKDNTLEELEQIVMQHAAQLWDVDPKQTQLIQYTFPFTTLSDEDVEHVLHFIITEELPQSEKFEPVISSISVSPQALVWMRHQARKKFPLENGRGASKYVSKVVVPKLGKALYRQSELHTVHIDFDYSLNDLAIHTSKAIKDDL